MYQHLKMQTFDPEIPFLGIHFKEGTEQVKIKMFMSIITIAKARNNLNVQQRGVSDYGTHIINIIIY